MALFSLTKKSDYGLSLLAILTQRYKKKRVNLTELSNLGYPRAFMAQIANNLVAAGIINSKEGRGGGYGLNYEPERVQIKEALEAMEGELAPVSCVVGEKSCPAIDVCGQKSFMAKLISEISGVLEGYTLADLVPNADKKTDKLLRSTY